MPFGTDMPAAARRHLLAAEELNAGMRHDRAGYLYGIAAECAVKAMMLEAGMRPISEHKTTGDPFFAHFPDLKTTLRDTLKGRRSSRLIGYIGNKAFMNNWSTRMRYCHGREIRIQWVQAWAQQAKQVVAAIGT
jgi:hypothetical protein